MYNVLTILNLKQRILSQLDAHSKDLKECKSRGTLNPTPDTIPGIFDKNSILFIPELVEVWTKLNVSCFNPQFSSAIYVTTEVKRLSTYTVKLYKETKVKKNQMNAFFTDILTNLVNLSKAVVDRICKERIALLNEDEELIKELEENTGESMAGIRLQVERRALRRTKIPEKLNDEETVKLLSISTKLFESGIATDYACKFSAVSSGLSH